MEPRQVQLVCLDATLVITTTEKAASARGNASTTASCGSQEDDEDGDESPVKAQLELIPTLLELLFYTPDDSNGGGEGERPSQRFLSYVESQHEISLVFDEALLRRFPPGALEYEPIRWKALQVASAGTGAFLSQLAVLTELTSTLARHKISVFQISTYQSDYVLVKVEDLQDAVRCLQSFCAIEREDGEEMCVDASNNNNSAPSWPRPAAEEKGDGDSAGRIEPHEVAVHQHVLSIPDIDLHLVQVERRALRRHMFALVQLLFGRASHPAVDPLGTDDEDGSEHFLSYSETVDGVSIVTSNAAFIAEARALAERGNQGITVSPDDWKVVQIGATKLGFSETGIVAGQTRVLVNAGTMVFYISTYATDFMLIKDDEWDAALPILQRHFDVIEGRFAALTDQP